VLRKLHAIRMPDTPNVRTLWRESAANQGNDESIDATDPPNPNSTRTEGSAQQSRVLRDVNNEK
jgi:hypothetical protein